MCKHTSSQTLPRKGSRMTHVNTGLDMRSAALGATIAGGDMGRKSIFIGDDQIAAEYVVVSRYP